MLFSRNSRILSNLQQYVDASKLNGEGYAGLNLIVMKPFPQMPDAQTVFNIWFQKAKERRDYVLLERYTIIVAGVEAELFAFSFTWNPNPYPGIYPLESPAVARRNFFNQGGLIWEISFFSYMSKAEEDEIHFKHILETIEFLD